MRSKWSATPRWIRVGAVVLVLYVVEAVVVRATAENRADGVASILIGGFATFFGVVLLGLAWHADYVAGLGARRRLLRGAETAPATVADVLSFHGTDFGYPVFEYTTPDGVTRRRADASSRGLPIGAEAVIRYSAGDPDRAVGPLGGFHALVFGVLAAFGALFTVLMPLLTIQSIVN